MSDAPHLLVEKRDGVLTLSMNRPKARHALSPQLPRRRAGTWRACPVGPEPRDLVGADAGGTQDLLGVLTAERNPPVRVIG